MKTTTMQEAIEYLRSFNLLAAATILEDRFLNKEKVELQKVYSAGYEAGKSDYEQNNR